MLKRYFVILLCLGMLAEGLSQSSAPSAISNYTYHPPSTDKQSWQRLNLWLSSVWYKMNTSGFSKDSALIYTSKSLGLSLLTVIAEGIKDADLLAQSRWVDDRNPAKGTLELSQFTGKKHLEQLILLGAYYAFESTKPDRFRDSSEYFLMKAANESKTIKETALNHVVLCLLVKLYSQYGDTAKGDHILTQLMNECKSPEDKNTLARAFLFRALYLRPNPQATQQMVVDFINERISNANKALEIYHSLKNIEGEINTLTNIAYFDLFINRFHDAYPILMKALQLENSIGYPYTHYTTDYLTQLGIGLGKFGEPLKYAMESVRVAEITRDSIGWADFYWRLAAMYYTDSHREEEALKWMRKAFDRFVSVGDVYNIYITLFNVVDIMTENLGREQEALNLTLEISTKFPPKDSVQLIFLNLAFAAAYTSLKQYKLAEHFALAADSICSLAKFKSVNISVRATTIMSKLATLYVAEGQYVKARKYLDLYLSDSTRAADLENDMHVCEQMLKIDSALNDPVSAVKHYKIYTQLIDSNYRVSKIRQAEELQVMYQTKEKQDSIISLNQQAKLERASLKQATLVKNLTIASAILLMILVGLIYNRYRQKQKTNKLLQVQQVTINQSNADLRSLNEDQQRLLKEKEWLIKEIHHRVKNNLQMIISLLNAQSEFLNNPSAIDAIKESRERMQAIAIIHQKLYQVDDTTEVNLRAYINELVDNIKNSFADSRQIYFKLDVDDVSLDISQSVPLGLILNEAITNAIKYAYPKNEKGLIQVSLKKDVSDKLQLRIADHGKGLPDDINTDQSKSLGLQLIKLFSEQLEGELYFINNNGLEVILNFKATEYKNAALINTTA